MPLQRRRILTLLAAGPAAVLAACGGGGDGYGDAPTRFMWLLNINPEVASADVSFGPDRVAAGLPFTGLTQRIEAVYGVYTIAVRNNATGLTAFFDNFHIDDLSPAMTVFYRKATSVRLGASPVGIVNYFDSTEPLAVELDDGFGNVQLSSLVFEGSAPQASASANCQLRLRRASDGVLVYDSGLRFREGAILIFPADPSSGLVTAVGLSYTGSDARVVVWPNIL